MTWMFNPKVKDFYILNIVHIQPKEGSPCVLQSVRVDQSGWNCLIKVPKCAAENVNWEMQSSRERFVKCCAEIEREVQ